MYAQAKSGDLAEGEREHFSRRSNQHMENSNGTKMYWQVLKFPKVLKKKINQSQIIID